MGIINMMIVIPMLIQSVSFGWIYSTLLGDKPGNAILFAAAFLAIAAVLMLWIKEPRTVETSMTSPQCLWPATDRKE